MNRNIVLKNERVVIMRIMGGLASQMHKYGIGRTLADKHQCELLLDLTWFEKQDDEDTKREFLLDRLNTRFKIASSNDINKLKTGKLRRKLSSAARKLGLNDAFIKCTHYIRGVTARDVYDSQPSIYIEGEWFGGGMLKDNKSYLLKDFSLRNNISNSNSTILKSILECESVAIHVRRGDFVSNPKAASFHCLTNSEYYKQAVIFLESKIANPKFYIFSDDPIWAKKNLGEFLKSSIFLDVSLPDEDMYLIKHCRHQIIANSGFGWFGAWLNTNAGKILIAPKSWVNDTIVNNDICIDLIDQKFILI